MRTVHQYSDAVQDLCRPCKKFNHGRCLHSRCLCDICNPEAYAADNRRHIQPYEGPANSILSWKEPKSNGNAPALVVTDNMWADLLCKLARRIELDQTLDLDELHEAIPELRPWSKKRGTTMLGACDEAARDLLGLPNAPRHTERELAEKVAERERWKDETRQAMVYHAIDIITVEGRKPQWADFKGMDGMSIHKLDRGITAIVNDAIDACDNPNVTRTQRTNGRRPVELAKRKADRVGMVEHGVALLEGGHPRLRYRDFKGMPSFNYWMRDGRFYELVDDCKAQAKVLVSA